MKSPGPYVRYLATGSTLSSQICVGYSPLIDVVGMLNR